MRIAYVFDQILPSTETDSEQALNTVAALSRQGADITLVLPRHLGREAARADTLRDYYQVDGDFRVERLASVLPRPRALEKATHSARAALWARSARDFDLVYTRNVSTLVAALAAGHRVAYETYRPWPDQSRALGKLFATAMMRRNFVMGVFHSEYARRSYLRVGVDPGRLVVVYNGYDPGRFTPALSRQEARARVGLTSADDPRPIAAYVGRVTMAKGVGVILETAKRCPEVRFVIVGSEGHGEVERAAVGIENVELHPWASADTLPPWLFAADVLLIPPTLAPLSAVGNTVLPMKLFLYLAAGRPILAPRAPDTAELLEHERNAWLVTPDDPQAAADALRKLTTTEGLMARLGTAARKRAETLTWDARAQRILAELDKRL